MNQTKFVNNNQWTTKGMSLEERFWSKVDWSIEDQQCWNWLAATQSLGYGLFWWDGKYRPAHRIAYELEVGPIEDGLELDHLCRNPNCVRPDHLEPVTPKENQHRGQTHASKTHCIHGHEFTPENTYLFVNGKGYVGRMCKACGLDRKRRAKERKRGL